MFVNNSTNINKANNHLSPQHTEYKQDNDKQLWPNFKFFKLVSTAVKGILSTSCVIFSYPKLLSISVLTFIKWRLTPSYVAKDTIFWHKRPKTIVIRIIVWMTIFKSIHMIFYVWRIWNWVIIVSSLHNNISDIM
jgi:hypothetical protein